MRIRTLVAAAAAPLALGGLLLTTAGAASAGTSPGTTGPGSWQFLTFDPTWYFTDGIQTTQGTPVTTVTAHNYQAQVQPPINAPGQIPSVFSNKTRTIPVKYTVQKQDVTTTTTPTSTVYPGLLQSYADPGIVSTNLYWNAPAGLTVGQISNLTANFSWAQGSNHGGSLRWQIDTPDGNIWVYYGDLSTTFQSGTGGSGDNMMAQTDARFEGQGFAGSPQYDTLADVLARPAPAGTVADEPVQSIGLITDGGWGGAQAVQLDAASPAVTIVTSAGTSTYTPGTVQGNAQTSTGTGPWVSDTTDPMWISLTKLSSNAPAEPVDGSTITSTQGDSGGQFRVADGMYMYNLPMSQLNPTAQYKVGISPNSDGSGAVGLVQFGLR